MFLLVRLVSYSQTSLRLRARGLISVAEAILNIFFIYLMWKTTIIGENLSSVFGSSAEKRI
jgi:hypothetical protein